MRKREPCSVDIWLVQVVQNSSRFQIEANKPHVFRIILQANPRRRKKGNNIYEYEKDIFICSDRNGRLYVYRL